MFGIGTWEWVLIIIIALVFLGPDKLPEVARSAGKGMRAVRKALRGLEEEVGPITRPMTDLDPRRVFEDAVRERSRPGDGGASVGPDELPPEDVAPAAPPPHAAPPVAPMEADGRVAAGPPLARPEMPTGGSAGAPATDPAAGDAGDPREGEA